MFVPLKQSISVVRKNPVRTSLTALGIIIGIASVIMVLSAGEGFKSYINSQVEAFGTNFITVETRVPPTTKSRAQGGSGGTNSNAASQAVGITTLKAKDVEDIEKLPNISGAYGAVIGQKIVSYKSVNKNAFIFGSNASRFSIDKGVIAKGRPYTENEDRALSQVAVLGHDIALDLFGPEDPLGKTIRVGTYNFLVVGVYEQRGSFGFSNDDQQVFVPLQTAQKKLLGIDHLFYVLAQAKDSIFSEATAEDMRSILRDNHNIKDPIKDDFLVQTQASGLETFDQILQGVTFLLIAVAAISLLVGGVGIMNIMYVAVTERIAEIGLKKAVGARQKDILLEFLTEALVLTLIGGVLGVALGALLSFGVALGARAFGFSWDFVLPISGVFLALGISSGIGLLFGVFPARRAAKMQPMEALRSE